MMIRKCLLIVVACGLMAGCGSVKEGVSVMLAPPTEDKTPDPTAARVTFVASKDINPNSVGRPSPIILDIYQLSNYQKFLSSGFFDLYESRGQELGADLVKRDQVSLDPGDSAIFEVKVERDTRYIGVVGGFIDINAASWRGVVDVELHAQNDVLVRIEGKNLFVDRPRGSQVPSYGYKGAIKDAEQGLNTAEEIKDSFGRIKKLGM